MTLVNQPTAAPSRKWWAGLIAGVVVNAAYGALDVLWPGHPFEPYKGEIIGWVVLGVALAAGYFSRNKAIVSVDKAVGLQELGSGGGGSTVLVPVRDETETTGETRGRELHPEGQGEKT